MHEAIIVLFSFVFYYVVIGIPVSQILYRTGFSRWLALLILIPVINLIALWMFAFGACRTDYGLLAERERNRQLDNWSDADKEAFRNLMNKAST